LAHNGQGLRAVIFIVLRNLQGIILSKALKIQKDPEEIGAQMAIDNLQSKVIELQHKNKEKEDILNTLAEDLIESQPEL
jgi:predicted nuclease with TOPRIM domain